MAIAQNRGGARPGAGRPATRPKAEIRNDGWANALVGLSRQKDKQVATTYGEVTFLPQQELEKIYLGDGIGSRLIDAPVDDMTREWLHLEPENEDNEETSKSPEEVEGVLQNLNAETTFNEALKWARLYGGSLILIGALDGNELNTPLNTRTIKDIEYLKVIGRFDVHLDRSVWQTDPTKKGYGKPENFSISLRVGTDYTEQLVHASRVIIIPGKAVPPGAALINNTDDTFWGTNYLQQSFDALKDIGATFQSVTNVLFEFIIGKYKIANLGKMISEGKEDQLQTRMEIISMYKSVLHSVILGENEEYTRDTASLSGVDSLIDRYMMRLSGTSGIPVTRLFGRSAAGMNATGAGDEKVYFDMIRSDQRTKLKPGVQKLVEVICAWKGITEKLEIEFYPLFQLSEKEEAETEKIEAETKKIIADTHQVYVGMGALDAETVFNYELKDKMAEVVSGWPEPEAPAISPEQQALIDNQTQLALNPPAETNL